MSWSVNFIYPPAPTDEDIKGWINKVEQQNEGSLDAFIVASTVASLIIHSRVVGDENKTFNVSLSGHHNPDYEPREGYSNNIISVAVSQRKAD